MIKNKKKLVFHFNKHGESASNPLLLRINLFLEYTKIDFGYVTTDRYDNGGWIKIAPETFIENVATKERFIMTNAIGITVAPALRNFESNKDWQYFSLYFPPIEQKEGALNIIEVVNGSKDDFNYYNIPLKLKDAVELL